MIFLGGHFLVLSGKQSFKSTFSLEWLLCLWGSTYLNWKIWNVFLSFSHMFVFFSFYLLPFFPLSPILQMTDVRTLKRPCQTFFLVHTIWTIAETLKTMHAISITISTYGESLPWCINNNRKARYCWLSHSRKDNGSMYQLLVPSHCLSSLVWESKKTELNITTCSNRAEFPWVWRLFPRKQVWTFISFPCCSQYVVLPESHAQTAILQNEQIDIRTGAKMAIRYFCSTER